MTDAIVKMARDMEVIDGFLGNKGRFVGDMVHISIESLAQCVREHKAKQAEGELQARIEAAKLRLRDAKAIHSRWYDMPKYESEKYAEMQMNNIEQIIYSSIMYLEGVDGPNRQALTQGDGDE